MPLTQVPNAMLSSDLQGVTPGFKNRIINGSMVFDQRNAGASVTPVALEYQLDRWRYLATQASKITVQQSTTAPTGFTNSMLVTSSSAYSPISTDYFLYQQFIEGLNCFDLAWGTASAKSVTLSFWVRSSLTGTFGGTISNASRNRVYPFTYTISSANTWEQKSVTIPGDTTGTWLTTSNRGIAVEFSLGSGTDFRGTPNVWAATDYRAATGETNVVATSGATWYITGVQLEVGTVATSFDFRSYGTELALCQRYFYFPSSGQTGAFANNTNYALVAYCFPVPMRATPTFTRLGTYIYVIPFVSGGCTAASAAIESLSKDVAQIAITTLSNTDTKGAPIAITTNQSSFSAEL